MTLSVIIFIGVSILLLVWIMHVTKKLRHKFLMILVIGLFLFGYFTFNTAVKYESIDLKTVSGVIDAGKIYFSWLLTAFKNMKSVTAYATQNDWGHVVEYAQENITKSLEEEIWKKL